MARRRTRRIVSYVQINGPAPAGAAGGRARMTGLYAQLVHARELMSEKRIEDAALVGPSAVERPHSSAEGRRSRPQSHSAPSSRVWGTGVIGPCPLVSRSGTHAPARREGGLRDSRRGPAPCLGAEANRGGGGSRGRCALLGCVWPSCRRLGSSSNRAVDETADRPSRT
jgi:hypothetical protein